MRILLAGVLLCWSLLAPIGLWGEDSLPSQIAPSSSEVSNAAVVYWQAFAALPVLSEAEEKIYTAALASTEKLPAEAIPVVSRFETALQNMKRAVTGKHCDWELDYSAGPGLLLPHLSKLRDLARAAQIRAKLRFQAEHPEDAVADLVATLRMARHAAASPVLISYLVGTSIEKSAMELLALHLPELDRTALEKLAEQLASLPSTPSIEACVIAEEKLFVGWLERGLAPVIQGKKEDAAVAKDIVARLKMLGFLEGSEQSELEQSMATLATVAEWQRALAKIHRDYQRLAEIAGLNSASQRRQQMQAFESDLEKSKGDATGLLSRMLLPAISRVIERASENEIRRALLLLAVQGQRSGLQSLAQAPKPGPGELRYQDTSDGFVVEYRESADRDWQTLRIGSPQKQPE